MIRAALEHLIRASATIADDDDIVVIGSQSVLGSFPDAPAELLVSVEADVYPRNHPDRADLIDSSIGEGSLFHETFGYYAQGVAPETAVLPSGWESRLVPITGERTRGATGWCLEIHDLVVSKLVAGREKDWEFARACASHGLIKASVIADRVAATELAPETRVAVTGRVRALF